MPSDVSLDNSPEPKDIQFIILGIKEKQESLPWWSQNHSMFGFCDS